MRRFGLVLGALVVVLVAGGAWYLAPIGPIATGYAAQIGCGAHLVSGRTLDAAVADLPDNPLVPFLRVSADDVSVRATLLGAYDSVAVVTDDGGCRLVDPDDATSLATVDPTTVAPSGTDDLDVPADPAAAAAAQGFDTDELTAAVAGAFEEDDDPATDVGTRAVVVVRDGTVVAERYADGFDADTPLLGWSMTKSVGNAIVGSLVAEGALALDDTDLLPLWREEPADPRRDISLEHLLTMTDGLAFEEVYDPGTDATEMLFTPGDTAAYAADQPLVAQPPGSRWAYSSGTTNILCEVAARADGGDPATLAARRVFGPLSMTSATVGTDASGDPVCSSYGYATARDWARFGQLYLQDGVWGGERLLPEGWVDFSRTAVDLPTEQPYGAQFWLNTDADARVRMPSVPEDAYWASGNEGQQVVVLPSDDLVVVRLGLSRGFDGVDWGLEPLLAGVLGAAPDEESS